MIWNKSIWIFVIFLSVQCNETVSSKIQKQDNGQQDVVFNKGLVLNELKLRVDTMKIRSSDLSISLNYNHKEIKYLFKSLKENQVNNDELMFYSINNYLLKIFLHHERNGCCGHNMNHQDDKIAEWMINTAKEQLPYHEEFKVITVSGFIYYAIKEDSLKLPHDTLIYNMISPTIDSCLNIQPHSSF